MDLSNFGQKISDAAGDTSRVLPPVDRWDPPFCGDINLTIKLDGSWHYEGTPIGRRALVRLSSGRYKKVKVGDRIDGGQIVAIGDSELRYQKGGRNVVLRMPRG